MPRVVAEINQNNSHLPEFFARLRYSATIIDKQHNKTEEVSGDGRLLYRWPKSLILRANKDVVGPIFELGSNDTEFWFKVLVGDSRQWWGHYANLDKPCCTPMPIRPDLVLEVLGVSLFDRSLFEEPAPVMRFNNEADAYMFVWSKRGPEHWFPWKEIWYDRASKSPQVVRLFNPDGRVILEAKLSGHAPVERRDLPRERWPILARHYELLFLQDGSRMDFDMVDVPPRPAQPVNSFRRPLESDTKEEIQIDKDCAD